MDSIFDAENPCPLDTGAKYEKTSSYAYQDADDVSESPASALETMEDVKPYVATHFFVDYENVRAAGLTGIEYLREVDEVIVVYTANAESISWDLLPILRNRNVYPIKVPTGPQSADKHLIALLASDIGFHGNTCKYAVVSHDSGYAPILTLLHERFGVFVQRKTILRADPTQKQAPSTPLVVSEHDSLLSFSSSENLQDKNQETVPECYASIATNLRLLENLEELTSSQRDDVTRTFVQLAFDKTKGSNTTPFKTIVCATLKAVLGEEVGGDVYRNHKKQFTN